MNTVEGKNIIGVSQIIYRGIDEKLLIKGTLFNDFQAAFGENLDWNSSNEILALARNISKEVIKPKIYAACGTEDYLLEDNRRFNGEMKKLDFEFTYEEWPGSHSFYFFDEALKKALELLYKK